MNLHSRYSGNVWQHSAFGTTGHKRNLPTGVSKGTVERIERGDSVQVVNFIKVLRACGMLENFLSIFPDDSPSPMQLLYMGKIKSRQRARSPHKNTNTVNILADNAAEYNADKPANDTSKTPWVWNEDK